MREGQLQLDPDVCMMLHKVISSLWSVRCPRDQAKSQRPGEVPEEYLKQHVNLTQCPSVTEKSPDLSIQQSPRKNPATVLL